uniref:Capsid protein n=1 Tax=Parvoviridae sp. TaxID=1940570 RepID=A0A7D3QPM1_9VIRU|nr:MAG: hypothetical protein [Parvoviridae sp.]
MKCLTLLCLFLTNRIGPGICHICFIAMAESVSLSNSYLAYITNQPYIYPSNKDASINVMPNNGNLHSLNTGWHIFPTMLWKHFVTPRQWAELNINYEAFRVDGYTLSAFNMIPLTTQLAIQGNTIFTAFNNCIYAIAYQDKIYETEWYNWYYRTSTNGADINLMYKEGLMQATGANTSTRFVLPHYVWQLTTNDTGRIWTWNDQPYNNTNTPNTQVSVDGVYPGLGYVPNGLVWDPLNRPDDIMELRPGKNAINFKWQRHECDENKWFNFDAIASWFPYTADGPYNFEHQRPGEYKLSGMMDPHKLSFRNETIPPTNDYTIANWAETPIVPMQWWWQEMQKSIGVVNAAGTVSDTFLKHMNLFFAGTERECYMYGPTQSFIKMIPIIDSQGTNIECSAQIAVRTTLHLSCKKRRSAIYCPTWGPFPWRAVYSGSSDRRNFFGSYIRYRTGGMRRTWQNLGDSSDVGTHPRKTPYIINSTVPDGTGIGSTFTTLTTTTATMGKRRAETKVTPSAPPMPPPYHETEVEMHPEPIYPPIDQFKQKR